MFNNISLTLKIFIITILLVTGVWFAADKYQTNTLKKIFYTKLTERFALQAKEHRTSFDHYVRSYNQAARLYASSRRLLKNVTQPGWQSSSSPIVHRTKPGWVYEYSVMRRFVTPRYFLLYDAQMNIKEAWNIYGEDIPNELLNLTNLHLRLAQNQSHLTLLNDKPYLITFEAIKDREDNKTIAYLMLSSPIDSEFMYDSQELTLNNIVALLKADKETVMVSSNAEQIPAGIKLSELKNLYEVIGEGFFDYGSSELVINFVSFIPTEEVQHLTSATLTEERKLRLIAGVIYTVLFMSIILLVTRRLKKLTQRIVDFSDNMSIQLPTIKPRDQLIILEDRFKRLANAIRFETAALEHQASHDPLTDLPNRKKLNELLQNELLKNVRTNEKLVLIIGDLNHFKEINDTLGHHIGDLVLQQAAERLYNNVRKSDTVARLGGDEFSILLPNIEIDEAIRIVKDINKEFKHPFIAENNKLNVGISLGLVEAPTHGDDVNILVQRADVAMYNAKKHNLSYTVYDPKNDDNHISRLQLMAELRDAIEKEKLNLYFQPKYETLSGALIGAEALIRWHHPVRGLIEPDEFIPMAEQSGLIKSLTRWIIKVSTLHCAQWHQLGFQINVSINVSTQCIHDPKLIAYLYDSFKRNSLPPEYFTLEITESDIMTHPIRAKSILNKIKSMGANISIDDFGTGYSSLAYLKQLPVDEIKIDRSFVLEMANDENDKTIVQAVIDLARNLGHKVIAEGVETKEAMDILTELRCDYVQGFYTSPPLAPDEFSELLSVIQGIKQHSSL
ncbi:MAG: EAL domain-containing protein [Gammaproteobacteria bacterium]